MAQFLKVFKHHMIDAGRTDLSHSERLDLELRAKGGYDLYQYLHSLIVRELWEDHKGFPIKKKFYDNKLLACTVSIRKITNFIGWGNQKTQEVLKMEEQLHWMERNNQCTLKGQTVYILGTWHEEKNEKGEIERIEKLFRDEERNNYIKQPKKKPKENDYSMYNYSELID